MTNRRRDNRVPRKESPFTEIVEGEPFRLEGRVLVPLVRVTSRAKRRAHLRGDTLGGRGYGFVHMRPVAILDKGQDGEQRHQIPNATTRFLFWLASVALAIPPLVFVSVQLIRRFTDRRS